jgi:hypothetical protein
VTPPSTLLGISVLGSPLTVTVKAGAVDASRSSVNLTTPPNLVIGSHVTARITLVDAYGNPITAPAAGQYNDSRLVVYGEQCSLALFQRLLHILVQQ